MVPASDRYPDSPPSTMGAWSLLGPGCLCRGDLVLSGDVEIHGRLEGMLFTDGAVWIAADGSVEGGVHAVRIVVEGLCRGRLEGLESVVLRSGSVARCDVETQQLVVEDGARFSGDHSAARPGSGSPRTALFRDAAPGNA